MKLFLNSDQYIDTDKPLDISIPMVSGNENLRAWYVDPPLMEPVRANGFVGSVAEGGSVNFRNIFFNPHGHVTHTECLGHITNEVFSVNKSLKTFFYKAMLVTIQPAIVFNEEYEEEDLIITLDQLQKMNWENETEALVIRTLPNPESKMHKNYSASNSAYMSVDCVDFLNKLGIKHLLIDLPSVDRESDGGKLLFHHGFWNVPENPDHIKTITEFIFVENEISDGEYLLELQMAPFENDASPSRPVLYKIYKA